VRAFASSGETPEQDKQCCYKLGFLFWRKYEMFKKKYSY
jgi:hypothetical protein